VAVAGTAELTWGALLAVLAAADFDLRSRRVPAWLTGGGIAAGVLLAAWNGPSALVASLGGAVAGGLVFMPFVGRGWLGGADALLLAAVGAWQGWRVALWAAWWRAAAWAALAPGVWAWRRRRANRRGAAESRVGAGPRAPPFPYVPAILAGAILALVSGAGA
jgi:Flp pilus assembly protein protease CpaA